MSNLDFHSFVPSKSQSRIRGATAREHAAATITNEIVSGIFENWKKLFSQPFVGITNNGKKIPGLFSLQKCGAPTKVAAQAALKLLGQLSIAEKEKAWFPIDSKQWRNWQNTEIYIEQHGLRLEELRKPTRLALLDEIKCSLSSKGYQKVRDIMRLNYALGDLVGGPGVMGEWSYTFCLFGDPSFDSPWGWQLFGHHLAINCIFIGDQMIISPTFMGAEPTIADEGPFAGTLAFQDEDKKGLEFMCSLSARQQMSAIVSHSMIGDDLPIGRRQPGDGLHLGGAYQDNRIIPYEGAQGDSFSRHQKRDLLDLMEEYICILPKKSLNARMAEIEQHLDKTHFCWIGSRREDFPFYYRIQSPIILIEFDHHAGVYLTNREPASFHVHTLVRTPNGNDYGIDLIRQHYQKFH